MHIGIVRSGNAGLATIDSCTIQNFTENGIYLDNSSATVQNCIITIGINASRGIYATGDNSNPTIVNNTISGVHIGIERSGNPGLATIRDNNISSGWIGPQNYPNPFNFRTKIRFHLPSPATLSITIYNIRGSLIQELVRGQFYHSGWVEVPWDGTNRAGLPVSSGVYFYRLEAQGVDSQAHISQTRNLLLVR